MADQLSLPVLPLRDTVVFPGVAVPISAGRPGTVEAVQEALDGDRRLFAVAQGVNQDDPDIDVLYRVGTIVRIVQTHRVKGGIQLLVQGDDRAQVVRYEEEGEGMLRAVLLPLERVRSVEADDPDLQAMDQELRDRAAELGTRRGVPAEALNQLIQGVDEPGSFADLVAFYLELPTEAKQKLLEEVDDKSRMEKALVAVEKELARIDAQQDIQARVQEELGERQREMLLREQLKQIQKELGDEGERQEVEELRERIEALDLPEEAEEEAERELNRLERTSPQSAEFQVIRTYLEWITELPWSRRTEDKIDLPVAEEILDEDHYGLEDVKDRILEFLAVRKLQQDRGIEIDPAEAIPGEVPPPKPTGGTGDGEGVAGSDGARASEAVDENGEAGSETAGSDGAEEAPAPGKSETEDSTGEDGEAEEKTHPVGKAPILLFVGPPGVGKTSIAQSIARSMGRRYVRISLGGARDEADIRGHRRTYVGAMPGRIIQGMRTAKSKNPVFLLDEVDKLGASFQGDPSSALLEVLDPAQNSTFTDHYMGTPFDLSEVLFICTANYLDRIPAPLLDRMERVEFSGYTEREKLEIAKRYLLPRQLEENGLEPDELKLDDQTILELIQKYTREAGVRQLERELGKLARKVARKIATEEVEIMEVTPEVSRELLGRPRVHPEQMAEVDRAGVATGMFYTPMGGDIMFVEASVMPGEGNNLVLTGQLGDVMKESGRAALTWAKSHHRELGISEDALKGKEVHIHVPAGAVPKDGPSAGITMAVALISAVSGRRVRRDLAMTGELTLTGRVLPIGGVKQKVLGAHRAGIREVIIPRENEPHLDDISEEVRDQLTFHMVDELDDVLRIALLDPPESDSTGDGAGGDEKTDEREEKEPELAKT